MDSTVANRINTSQVVSVKKTGMLGSALMSDKKKPYKKKNLKYKLEENKINVKKKLNSQNMEEE